MQQTELWPTSKENYKIVSSLDELLMHAYNDDIVEYYILGCWKRIAASSILARSVHDTKGDIIDKAFRVPLPSEVIVLVECETDHDLFRWFKAGAIPGPQWAPTGRYVRSAVLFK